MFEAHYEELNDGVQSIMNTWEEIFEAADVAQDEHTRVFPFKPRQWVREVHEKRPQRRKAFLDLETRVIAANEAWQTIRRKEREFQAAYKDKPRDVRVLILKSRLAIYSKSRGFRSTLWLSTPFRHMLPWALRKWKNL